MKETIFVTGGAGFIGSHTSVELLEAGYHVVIADNFVNSKPAAIENIKKITGKDVVFYEADVGNAASLRRIFSENKIDAVIHFAGLKAVGESVAKPLLYYRSNIAMTVTLLETMAEFGIKKIVFSSSATVYGEPQSVPIREDFPLSATNPYGRTKLTIEYILKDVYRSDESWSISLLRYFNPVGAHISGLIGEDPAGIPNNLVPYISKVASGELECLGVTGNDYPTPDGTGVRDYIHIVDLSLGHIKALEKVLSGTGLFVHNLGTGRGYSVLEMIAAYEKACGKKIPYKILPRRPGDIPTSFADTSKAERELGWKAERGIGEMCADSWNFIKNRAKGNASR